MPAVILSGTAHASGAKGLAWLTRKQCTKETIVFNSSVVQVARSCRGIRLAGGERKSGVSQSSSGPTRQRYHVRASGVAEGVPVQEEPPAPAKAVEAKLRDVGPLPGISDRPLLERVQGFFRWLLVMLLIVPLCIQWYLKFGLAYITTGGKKFQVKDRSGIEFPDPFPGLVHEYVDVNNVRLHVVRAGPKRAGKKLMLFVHGFPEGWFSWKNQLDAFKDDYDVVCFDMRGYGKSSKPKGRANYGFDFLVGDIVALVHALGYDTCVLVSHDWGAIISWMTAALHPDMVEGLVVTCVPHPVSWERNLDADQKKRSYYMGLFQAPALGELLFTEGDMQIIDNYMRPILSPEELEGWKAHMTRPGALTAGIWYYRALFDQSLGRKVSPQYQLGMERLRKGELPMPVLMMYGENDSALGLQLLKGTEDLVPNLELHVLPGSHFLQLIKPKEVTEIMRAFFGKNKI